MALRPLPVLSALLVPVLVSAAPPALPGIADAVQKHIAANEIAGAVTMVVTKDQVLHLEATGLADREASRPMATDQVFAIFSMTKPVCGAAILLLKDEGRLRLDDPVAKHIPEFAALKTPSGQPANLTLVQLLNHTSGLGEAGGPAAREAKTLAELIPLFLAAPMNFEPGTRWRYCQSSINTAARVVEVVSGQTFDEFVADRFFRPLGMKDTGHYPDAARAARIATAYAKNRETGLLEPTRTGDPTTRNRPPTGNSGLYSTAADYARFCQMLMNGGELDGRRYLSAAAVKQLSSITTGDIPAGFFQSETYGSRVTNYGWGVGTCVLREPHPGVAQMLSPGTFGHGGAWGTQAWIDPVKGIAYILMVQRANFPNSDASDLRRDFQQAAADAATARAQ
ncbi:MAG TPA: serine hydrolase domain-containing protein [Opitutaceae bacterium]|nr:serine hydrolase domain-containing protein [Opitutaceae bacterium]